MGRVTLPTVRRYALPTCAFLVAFATTWWLSSLRLLFELDWDNAAHLYHLYVNQRAGGPWGAGYTAHVALLPLYSVGVQVVRLFGGSALDGVRLINAFGISLATALIAHLLRAHQVRIVPTLLTCMMWLTAANTVFLVRTIEDDCVGLAVQAATAWALFQPSAPRLGRASLAGAVLAAGCLTNYACIVWLPVVLVWALVAEAPSIRLRLGRPLVAAVAFLLVVILWGSWTVYATRDFTWRTYLAMLVTSPNGTVGSRANQWDFIAYFARNLPHVLIPVPGGRPIMADPSLAKSLTWLAAVALVAGTLWPWRRGLRRVTPRGRAFSLACLAAIVCGIPAALKNDWTVHERLDHLPLLGAVLAGFWIARAQRTRHLVSRWLPSVLVAACLFFHLRAIALIAPDASWLATFARSRKANSNATALVYAESEFTSSNYNKIVSAVLTPGVRILSPRGAAGSWPIPPPGLLLVDDWKRGPLPGAWLSTPALALVAH
jgi:hypothetical protein